jgi:hypothetical protein
MSLATFSRLTVAFALLITCGSWRLSAQEPAQTDSFHVAIIVQRAQDHPDLLWNIGDPVLHLKPEDFQVRQGGSRLQVNVGRSVAAHPAGSVQATRLLVVIGPSVSDPEGTLRQLPHAFEAVWRQGWQTAVVRPDGSTTSYAAGPSSIAPTAPAAISYTQSYLASVKSLKGFDGITIVLYLTGSAQGDKEVKTPHALIESAKDSKAMLYVVDGGSPAYTAWTREPYSPRSYDLDYWIYDRIPPHEEYIDGVEHEVSVQRALQAMRLHIKGRYDLLIAPQPGHRIDSSKPLSIEVESKSEIRTFAKADGIGRDTPLEISQRTTHR